MSVPSSSQVFGNGGLPIVATRIVEEESPKLGLSDDAQPKRFSFVLVEKSSGGDKHKAVATIRSHTMKRLHEQRRALDKRARKDLARRQAIEIPPPTAALTIDICGTLWGSKGLKDLQFHVRRFFPLANAAAQSIFPCILQFPIFRSAFDWMWQCDLDAMRSAPPTSTSLIIKNRLLKEMQKQLLNKDQLHKAVTLMSMLMLIAGTSVCNNGQGAEMELHIKALYMLLRSRGSPDSQGGTESHLWLSRVISIQVLSMKADYSISSEYVLPKINYQGLDAPDLPAKDPFPHISSPFSKSEIPHPPASLNVQTRSLLAEIRQFSDTLISNPTGASTDTIQSQRLLQRRILSYPELSSHGAPGNDADRTYEAIRLTSHLLVHMAAFAVPRHESLPHRSTDPHNPTLVIETLACSLHAVLRRSDLVSYWDEKVGLLWWIVIVACAISRGMAENRFFKAVQLRMMQQFMYTQREWGPVLEPMTRFLEFQRACEEGFWKEVLLPLA